MSYLKVSAVTASVVVIITATLLPFNPIVSSQIPPQWCLRCGGLWMTDAVSNVLLFVPFGAACAWALSRVRDGLRVGVVLGLGLVFSLGIEWLQSIGLPPSRSAALADVLTNSLGSLLGAILVVCGPWLIRPGELGARVLHALWLGGALTVFVLTAVAMAPRSPAVPSDAVSAVASPYPHVPGQAWYGGSNDSVLVNGRVGFKRGWSGPFIVQLDAEPDTVRVQNFVRGREAEGFAVPLVFLHLPGDTAPVMQLRVNRDAAELSVTRRAWSWGLTFPSVVLDGAFEGRTLDDARVLELSGMASRHTLELRSGSGSVARVELGPTMGWAMLQSLVTVQSSLAWMVEVAWLGVLLFPVGWWRGRVGFGLLLDCLLVLGVFGFLAFLDWTGRVGIWEMGVSVGYVMMGGWVNGKLRQPGRREPLRRKPLGQQP